MASPHGWVNIEVGTLFRLVGGGTPSTTAEGYWGNGTPWISSADIDDRGAVTPRRSVTQEGIQNSTTNVVQAGTVIVVTRVGLGKLAILSDEMCFSQDIQALVPLAPDIIDARFLRYSLIPIVRKFKYEGRGTTISGITKKQLSDAAIPLPPLAEQRRIVDKIDALFSELDKGVEYLQTVKQQLQTYRQAVLKWAFEGKLTTTPTVRKTPLGEYIEKPRYGTSKKCTTEQKGLKVYRIPNIDYSTGSISQTDMKYADFSEDEAKPLKLQYGDILIIRSNGSVSLVGRGSMVRDVDTEGLYAGYLMRLRISSDAIIPKYLLYYLGSPDARTYIEAVAKSTSGVNNINSEEVRKLSLPVYDVEDQKHIVSAIELRLSVCDKLERLIDENLEKADAVRHAILQRAFDGRLAPQGPNDEPAEKLLERIKAETTGHKSPTKRRRANG